MKRPSAATLLLTIGGLTALGENMLYSLLPLYLKQNLGFDNLELGLFYLLISISSMVLRIPVGLFADLFGRARLVLLGIIMFLTGRLILLIGASSAAFAAAVALGLGVSMYYIPHAALVADIVSEGRGSMIGMFGKLNFLTQAMGALGLTLGGYTSQFFGREAMITASLGIMTVNAALALFLNFVVLGGDGGGKSEILNLLRDLLVSLKDRFLALYFIGNFANGVFFASFVFSQVLLSEGYGLPDGVIGLLLTSFAITGAISSYVAGRVLSSKSRSTLLKVQASVWLGVSLLALAAYVSAPLPLLILSLAGIHALLGIVYPVGSTVLYGYAPPRLRASVGNVSGLIWRTGHSVGTAVVPNVVNALGLRSFLIQACLAGFLSFLAFRAAHSVYTRRSKRNLQRVEKTEVVALAKAKCK